MSRVALDGIIPFALLGQGGGGGGSGSGGNSIKNAQFTDSSLVISTTQGNINVPFSSMLKHSNKAVLDNISVVENTLYFKGEKVCNLDETITDINISEDGILNILYGSGITQDIDLKPIIEQTINNSNDYSFYYGIVDTDKDLQTIEDTIKNGQLVVVRQDSNYNDNRTIYIYFNQEWVYIGDVEVNRDFTKDPINIEQETVGEFIDSRIPSSIARVSQLHFHNNLNILNKLQENVYGQLIFDGKPISDLKVTDGQNASYNKVNNITFAKTLGIKEGDTLKIIPKLKSIDLQDFPSNYKNENVLVSTLSGYELKSIEDLTDSRENFVTTINTSDWGSNEVDRVYKRIITHNLNSENLIVAFYDENKNSISKEYTILNPLNIEVKSNDNNITTVVINCSQGTAKNSGDGSGGNVDHIHNNLQILNGFGEDIYDNLTWNGKRIYTNFDPYVYNQKWKKTFEEKTLLVDCNQIFQDVDARIFSNIEFSITNANYKTGNDEIDKRNVVKLFIVENEDNTILDIPISAGSFQKYSLGINPTIKIYVTGFFSADLTINYFDNKSAYSSIIDNQTLSNKENIIPLLLNTVEELTNKNNLLENKINKLLENDFTNERSKK